MFEEFIFEGKKIKLLGGQIAGVKDGDYKYVFDDHEEFVIRIIMFRLENIVLIKKLVCGRNIKLKMINR